MSAAAREAPAPAAPFAFFELHVVRTRRLGPTMLRVTLGGEAMAGFASGGSDQSFSLFLPHPGQSAPVVPTGADWFARYRAMDPEERAVMRAYTVRAQRADELDVDFALHGDGGPASRWARTAGPGDRVTLLGPVVPDNKSVCFRLPDDADWVLLSGDETALPALGAILESLPAGLPARVFVEVPEAGDLTELDTAADAEITWLVRSGRSGHRTDVAVEALRSAALPPGAPYAWIAGEAGTVRALRRHLVNERGFARRAVTFGGYWRLGASEEKLTAEAEAGLARVPED
ncbi:siderophore-interacting protein [Streptomyces sp. DSM 42041]|uniref:Siderophore-interacting protein n=1 Tax=Streptomyces hazeniae TaxID=3075538 RepID=A0ABU2NY25_9ACTN|nr:siderophore-interacting protein [Streptomyces sp. DSM 42041]MDT0381901.1 siderophore-interacting protein [Streptomyces sp. DSM 42041]